MRNAVKDKTQAIQERPGGKATRPPDVPVRPGVWKGHPNPGGFQKGDPRIQGGVISRAKQRTIEAVATEYADEAVDALRSVYRDESAPPAARVMAAKEMLDRGYGKSVDRIAVAQLNDEAKGSGRKLTRDELMAHLSWKFTQEPTQADIVAEQPQSNQSLTKSGLVPALGTEGQDTPHPFSETNDENVT